MKQSTYDVKTAKSHKMVSNCCLSDICEAGCEDYSHSQWFSVEFTEEAH